MYKEIIFDILTGETTERPYTAAEIKEAEKAKADAAEKIAQAEARQNVRASALAKLAALGLTEDEIAAL